jgi:transcriptional regulator with XRE-family HTH domain
MSQEELAHRSGLHFTFLSGVERGIRNPGLNAICRIAAGLGVTQAKIFEEGLVPRGSRKTKKR